MISVIGLAFALAVSSWSAMGANGLPSSVETVLEKSEQLELLSLDPLITKAPPKEAFHGWRVLGTTTIKDSRLRTEIVAAMRNGIAEFQYPVAACFNPRHGIRAKSGDTIVDLVICFECRQIEAYANDKRSGGALTAPSPQSFLDQVLRDAQIPLASKPER